MNLPVMSRLVSVVVDCASAHPGMSAKSAIIFSVFTLFLWVCMGWGVFDFCDIAGFTVFAYNVYASFASAYC